MLTHDSKTYTFTHSFHKQDAGPNDYSPVDLDFLEGDGVQFSGGALAVHVHWV